MDSQLKIAPGLLCILQPLDAPRMDALINNMPWKTQPYRLALHTEPQSENRLLWFPSIRAAGLSGGQGSVLPMFAKMLI